MRIALALLTLFAGTAIAEDAPLPPAPPPPTPESAQHSATDGLAEADREFLQSAAAHQGGEALRDGVTSLRIKLGRIRGRDRTRQEDGTVLTASFDVHDAWFAWRRNADHAPSFVEHRAVNGKPVTRGLHPPRSAAWLRAGDHDRPEHLREDTHAEDLDQMRTNRRLIGTLAEMLVLGRLLDDAGSWQHVEDQAHAGRAYLREPADDANDALPFVIWFDEESLDPIALRLPPLAEGEAAREFDLAYDPRGPHVAGAAIRVPVRITAREADGSATPKGKTPPLELGLSTVSFEPLPDEAFAARQRPPPRTDKR